MSNSSIGSRRPPRALWLIAIPLVLVGVVWAAITVLFPQARVRALVSTQLSATLAREVRFTDASIGLWPPVRLSVREPAIAEPGGFTRGIAFQARSLDLDLEILPLLSRRIVVRRLLLDRAAVHLVLLADGTTNFDGMMKPSTKTNPGGKAMSLDIRELRLMGAKVLVDDLKAARRTTFVVESRVALRAEGGGERFATSGETMISGLAFGPATASRATDLNQSLAKLEWRIAHDGKFDAKQKRLALGKLGLRLGRTELALSGIVDDPGPNARIDLKTRASAVDLGAVLGYLAAADARAVHGLSGSGRLDFDLLIVGSLGPGRLPAIVGTLSVKDGAARYPGARAGIDALAFNARFAPDSVGIGDLRARLDGQPVQATLSATRFADPWVRFAVQGNIDLAAVAPLVAPADTKLGGRVAVDVRGSGRAKDPGDLALEGDATLSNVSVQSPALPQKVEGMHGTIRFTPAKASVSGLSASAGKSSFTLDATVTRPLALLAPVTTGATRVAPAGVDFDLNSPYLDLAEVLPTTPGAPILPNATGGGRVHIGRLRNQKLDVEDVTAHITLEPGVLVVPEYALRAYSGSAVGNARFDLRDPAKPVFDVKTQVDSLEADAVLSAWTPVKNLLHGTFNTTLALGGSGLTPAELKRSITAVGLAAVANGTLGPGPALEAIARYTRVPALKQLHFKDGNIPFRVEQGRVVTDPVVLNGPNGEWRFVGSVGFDGTLDYVVSATLPPEVVASLGAKSALAAGALSDAQGRLLLDLRLKGSAMAPQVSWDGQAMRDRLLGRASQALQEQRARLEGEARAAADARVRAGTDSARAVVGRAQQAATDSLKRRAGDALRGLFGGGARDTTKR